MHHNKPIQRVEITGSSIKRIAKEGALPVEVITCDQIEEQGIVSAEQLIAARYVERHRRRQPDLR